MAGVHSSLGAIVLPTFHEGLAWAAPVVTLAVLGWMIRRTDRVMHRLFPDLEWERNLGWLNIRAQRRATMGMRWVGYGILILLLDSLVGILWAAKDFPRLADWADPWVMGELALRVPALGLCLFIWVVYLGCGLLPRLRAEKEAAAYARFRAEWQAHEEEHAMESPPRTHAPLPKPRTNPQPVTLATDHGRRRHPPGG